MANNYFQFKQFTIQQAHCAMKVCTDACILGSYSARQISKDQQVVANILDIGTGTGLLSLMIAQKTNAMIDALEIDADAFNQALDNFTQSSWKNRLNIFNEDAIFFRTGKKYDFIICNPPFFVGDLKSGNKKKDAARHDTSLTLQQLLMVIDNHLSLQGSFAVLLPYPRLGFFTKLAAAANYFLNEQLLIRHTDTHPFFRGILFFSRKKTAVTSKELAIKEATGAYTPAFIKLLEDYYLPEGLAATEKCL